MRHFRIHHKRTFRSITITFMISHVLPNILHEQCTLQHLISDQVRCFHQHPICLTPLTTSSIMLMQHTLLLCCLPPPPSPRSFKYRIQCEYVIIDMSLLCIDAVAVSVPYWSTEFKALSIIHASHKHVKTIYGILEYGSITSCELLNMRRQFSMVVRDGPNKKTYGWLQKRMLGWENL